MGGIRIGALPLERIMGPRRPAYRTDFSSLAGWTTEAGTRRQQTGGAAGLQTGRAGDA
jgi:hypothetical protein